MPNMTNGNAAPSLRPASPVSPKRSRSRSRASETCTSPARTGSVGASAAAKMMDAPADMSSAQYANAATAAIVTTIATVARRNGTPQCRPRSVLPRLEPVAKSEISTASSHSRSISSGCLAGSSRNQSNPQGPSAMPNRK